MLGHINEEVPKHVDEAHNKVNHVKALSKSATAELANSKALPKKESPKVVLNGSNNQPSLNKKANNGPQLVTNNKERPPQPSYVASTTVNAGMSHFFTTLMVSFWFIYTYLFQTWKDTSYILIRGARYVTDFDG